ncbi:MAG: sulfate adenylyltransferase [Candidatus Methylomirabilales bacterium]
MAPASQPKARPGLVPPHGGRLRPLLLEGPAAVEARAQAEGLPVVRMTSRETSDLVMLASGAFSPLDGFMGKADYLGCVRDMRTATGLAWPIPITLAAPRAQARALREGEWVALVDGESGTLVGRMHVREKYEYDKVREAREVFRTAEAAHPGVAKLFAQGEVLLGGAVEAFGELDYPQRFPGAYARPAETRGIFEARGWKTVAAFQTRNPIHRSHEYCTKIALEIADGLLIHPVVGRLKDGDIPAAVRMRCYEALLQNYYPADRVVCKVYPMEMRYAGPREAVLHAIVRQNYGCSHLIVGRDHAGVGHYYGPLDAHRIFDELPPAALHIQPLKIDWTFWCQDCDGMASTKTCPHAPERRVLISGTKVRELLARGERPPREFTRPEVADILIEYYRGGGSSR